MDKQAISQVRLLIADEGDSPLLSDAQISSYLSLNGYEEDPDRSAVWYSAADALDSIAISEVLVSKKITTQDLSTDGPAVAESLRQLAASLRQRADAREEARADSGDFDIIGSGLTSLEGEEARL